MTQYTIHKSQGALQNAQYKITIQIHNTKRHNTQYTYPIQNTQNTRCKTVENTIHNTQYTP